MSLNTVILERPSSSAKRFIVSLLRTISISKICILRSLVAITALTPFFLMAVFYHLNATPTVTFKNFFIKKNKNGTKYLRKDPTLSEIFCADTTIFDSASFVQLFTLFARLSYYGIFLDSSNQILQLLDCHIPKS